MTAQVVVALVSAIVAVFSALWAAWTSRQSVRLTHELQEARDRQHKREVLADVMDTFSKPLLWAAYELAARLYHICQRDWLAKEIRDGNERQRSYAYASTCFVYAQYFTWVEILRRRIQFLDAGDTSRTHELQNLVEMVEHVASTERIGYPRFLVYRMELRGIAEYMIDRSAGEELQCVGYSKFMAQLDEPESRLGKWLDPFNEDLHWLTGQEDQNYPRLAAIQRNLYDLIKFLDPDGIRLPDRRVNRVPGENPAVVE